MKMTMMIMMCHQRDDDYNKDGDAKFSQFYLSLATFGQVLFINHSNLIPLKNNYKFGESTSNWHTVGEGGGGYALLWGIYSFDEAG